MYHLTAAVFHVKGLCVSKEEVSPFRELHSGLDHLNHSGFQCAKSPKELLPSVSDLTGATGAQDTLGGGESMARAAGLSWEAARSSSPLPWWHCSEPSGMCWHRTSGQKLFSLAPVLISCKLWLQTTAPALVWSVCSFQGGRAEREIKTVLQGERGGKKFLCFLLP